MSTLQNRTIKIELKTYGTYLATKAVAKELCGRVIGELNRDNSLTAVFEFDGVKTISSGFAHELFGSLYISFRDQFPKRVKLSFSANPNVSILKAVINEALTYASRTRL